MPTKKQTPKSADEQPNTNSTKSQHEFSDLINEAEKKLKSTLDDFTEKAEEVKGVAEYAIKEKLDETEQRVRKNPLASVAIAAGVGIIIGILLNRRR